MQSTQNNREVLQTLFQGDTFLTPEQEYGYRSEGFTAEIPQTGERFESREALRDMQLKIGQPPVVSLQRLTGSGDFWAVEAIQTYDQEDAYYVCVLIEFEDGRIRKETRYYGPPLQTTR